MIKSLLGITKEPFNRSELALLPQQKAIVDILKIHAQQGGFSVIVGNRVSVKVYCVNILKASAMSAMSLSCRAREPYTLICKDSCNSHNPLKWNPRSITWKRI